MTLRVSKAPRELQTAHQHVSSPITPIARSGLMLSLLLSPFSCVAARWESSLAHDSALCLKRPSKVGSLQVHPAGQLSWELTFIRQLKVQLGKFTCWIRSRPGEQVGDGEGGWMSAKKQARSLSYKSGVFTAGFCNITEVESSFVSFFWDLQSTNHE